MLAAAALFSVMGALTKAATKAAPGAGAAEALSGGEIAFFRYAFGILFLVTLHVTRGVDILGGDRRGLLWRGFFGGIASVLFFVGIERTSLTHATLLNYTYIIWAPLIAVYSLRERLHPGAGLAVIVAIAGVLLVTRPEVGRVGAGDLIALLSGMAAGLAVVQIRRLRQGETSYAVFFYFNLLGLPTSLLAQWLFGGGGSGGSSGGVSFALPAPSMWPVLLGIGVTSVGAQLLMTFGYREMTAAQGSLLSLTSVVFSALLAHTLFGEALPPTTLLGGALILGSAAALALASSGFSLRRRSRDTSR